MIFISSTRPRLQSRRFDFGLGVALLLPMALFAAEPSIDLEGELDANALYSTLSGEAVFADAAIELVEQLESKHYASVDIDDGFSSVVFDKYLDALDGSKLYLLASDVQRIARYRYTLDNSLAEGDLTPAYDIYNIYHQRVIDRLVYAIGRIDNAVPAMDFTVDEYLILDREDTPFAQSTAELDELWRKRVKNSVLSLKLTGDTNEEIVDKLGKRYRNQLRQVLKTNGKDVFQAYLSTVASSVDPHTSYFSPRDSENFNMGLSLSLQGIGAQLTTEDEYTKVVELIKGGPAERAAELQEGDKIIGIGQGVDGEIKDVVGMRLDDVVAQIRGEKDTVVRLSVIPVDAVSESSARVISITRDNVKLEDQSAKKEVIELSYADQDYRIGVISLPTFYFDFEAAARGDEDFKSSTRDVRRLLEELKEESIDAVVVDLRNDGGGSLSEANQLVGLFIETGPTVQIRYSDLRNGFTRSFGDNDPGVVYDGPLAVLVNRTSASASEIFAGAIQDYQRGLVLGGQTFGKGTVQEIIPMSYGQVKITRSKFYRISGASTQHRGVIPDIEFPDFYNAYDDIGESSLDGALPWDTVRPVEYRAYHPVQAYLPMLRELHEARAAESPDFNYLKDQIERTRELRERKRLSLNEEIVKAEREAAKRVEFDAENLRRQLKGLPLKEWIDEDEAQDEEAVASTDDTVAPETSVDSAETDSEGDVIAELAATDEEAEAEDDEPEEIDPLLLESGRILADFINLSNDDLSARF